MSVGVGIILLAFHLENIAWWKRVWESTWLAGTEKVSFVTDTQERRSYNNSPAHGYSVAGAGGFGDGGGSGLQASAASSASAIFSSIKGSAGNLVKNIRDASTKVMDTVSA